MAKAGAMMEEGFLAEARAETAALQYAVSFHCPVQEWKDFEELKPKPKEK